jgi:hypothetical protein
MLEKKVDGRKFNGGNKGCGRKSKPMKDKKTYTTEALAILFKKSISDKDMKLYMSYICMVKVSTSNETTMNINS